jgi:Lar family restriction alleviation protein
MKMTEVLKKCPFCGCKADIIDCDNGFYCYCRDCRASTRVVSSYEEAEKEWNKRVEDASKIGLS